MSFNAHPSLDLAVGELSLRKVPWRFDHLFVMLETRVGLYAEKRERACSVVLTAVLDKQSQTLSEVCVIST